MKGQRRSEKLPHASIHQSGESHVRAPDGGRSRVLYLPLLAANRGERVLTITPDSIDALPPFHGKISDTGPKLDTVALPPSSTDTVSLLVYINGKEPHFEAELPPQSITRLTRPGLENPVFVGVLMVASVPLAGADQPGVTTLVMGKGTPHSLFVRCL